jgi:hypothetical protein
MKIKRQPCGYTMWLSANDTYWWADGQGPTKLRWPGSVCSGKRLVVVVDDNGLIDMAINGKDHIDGLGGHELDAIVSDHLPKDLRHFWPTWEPKGTKSPWPAKEGR